ncbi:MAG TPA: glycosyltransferase, partial [Opitutus sp.]|nr:glycosyltransferase [Opitutus sp.]
LIRAAKRLVNAGWTGKLILGGGGKPSHRRAAEKLVAQLGLSGRVEFPGHVSNAAAIYHRCRAAVLSTHYEGLPLVLIDYMAAGCGAIASIAPGTDDLIQDGINGWLFPRGDDAALAGILTRVLAGGPEIERVVARARADAPARFSLEQMVNRYEELFHELLEKSAGTSNL